MYSIQYTEWEVLSEIQQSQLKALLLEADPSWQQVLTYLLQSNLFVMLNDQAQIIAQLCLLRTADQAEIKNLAVDSRYQKQGFAKALIQFAIENTRDQNIQTLWVKTGNSSLDQLALYQKCGFRLSHIERDVFRDYPEPIYENGIACLDQIVLSIVLR
ncbi:GNAT family acetyltransferase [Acinetobacter sp. Ac_3412]|uniref:GNAT family N-acetyltransferase n=1 Tax=Acinetobacter sp. Ac_3412 TaxID=1848935 RepID=UPI00148FEF4F|nr:GNAT family N-acetyltransferase [Acinetobacter sp. Ac_3412]NNP75049.1 GNAT family acetyltransferase [Acinetobacter sp. Ac_3412]